uniref:Uncharacterized protein n=1 Tax=Chionoecetes opilio bacilliform virus TaxID=1825681 RepID=A0A1Q3DLA6_9VIRU|nr:hypothetical protein SCV_131 [Chionoecetes opilio bacilliform virus]
MTNTVEKKTDCMICIEVDIGHKQFNQYRRRMKPCVSKLSVLSHKQKEFIDHADTLVDQSLVYMCSKCNSRPPVPSTDTTKRADQLFTMTSERLVYLGSDIIVRQKGVFYGDRFVPNDSGGAIVWASCSGYDDRPPQTKARLCCLLNFINTFDETSINDECAVKSIRVNVGTFENTILGPLGKSCISSAQLEISGPVLVFVLLSNRAQ